MQDLRQRYGSTALVTGASSGIGAAFARELARRGLDVVVVARRGERLEGLKRELEGGCGVRIFPVVQDLAAPDAAGKIEAALAGLGLSVDFLVANAGFGRWGDFGSYDRQVDLDMVAVNCTSVVDLTHRLIPPMKGRGRGAIVIVSSVLGQIPAPWMAVYSATKAFDKYLAESIFTELRPYGVDAISCEPTLTATEFRAGTGQKPLTIRTRTSEQVVATTLGALGKVPSIADGFFTRCWLFVAGMLPRKWILAIYERARKKL